MTGVQKFLTMYNTIQAKHVMESSGNQLILHSFWQHIFSGERERDREGQFIRYLHVANRTQKKARARTDTSKSSRARRI